MSTNPIGPDTKNLSVNMRTESKEDLEKLAAESGMTLSAYCREVFKLAEKENVTFERENRGDTER